ncbi:MAG: DNA repair exonuclease [Lewinellaceae bacterium]|nr:DNA repair exonuclease [Lewinellaceae bacterium]MCB9330635.1 DNA repair exonuclease [Lewinellaceae bacterium]
MRILHVSDTHLGFQAFDVVNEKGINAREQDMYAVFEHTVNRILEIKPDAVIHSGDFFHRPSPSNRALTFGLEQLRRICDAGIPVFIIAGNHETPKTVYTSPILRAFKSLPCVRPFFGETWESAELDGVVIHGLPHINDARILQEQLERLEPQPGKFNILMLHTSLGKRFLMEEYGEQIFPEAFQEKLNGFQYLALGHWHNFQKIDLHPNAWYCGSLERLSDTEIDSEKGFMLLDIAADGSCSTIFETVPARPWLKLDIQKCQEKTVADIQAEIDQFQQKNDTAGAILSVLFNDIKIEQSLELSNIYLRNQFPECFQLLPKRRSFSDRSFVRNLEVDQFDRLDQIFADYIREKYADNTELAQKMVQKAGQFFHELK